MVDVSDSLEFVRNLRESVGVVSALTPVSNGSYRLRYVRRGLVTLRREGY